MTNRPHVFTIHSSDDRRLATALIRLESVSGVSLGQGGLQVQANDYGSFTRALTKTARQEQIRLRQVLPADESLESVFSYLVAANDGAALPNPVQPAPASRPTPSPQPVSGGAR